MARGTGHRGPHFFSAPNLPFDGIPFDVAQATFLRQHISAVLGNGTYMGPLAAGTGGGWVMTDIAGTGAVTSDNEGALILTTGTTDENSTQLQNVLQRLKYSTTKNISFFARVKVSTAATTGALIGLCSIDTTLITAAAGAVDVDDGIFFYKDATDTDFTFHVRKDSTSTTQAMGLTLADATYVILGFTIVKGAIRCFAFSDSANKLEVLENVIGSSTPIGAGISVVATNAPDDLDLCLSLAAGQEGGTTARVLTTDWAFAVQEHA